MESLEKIILKFCAGAAVFCLCVLWVEKAHAEIYPFSGCSAVCSTSNNNCAGRSSSEYSVFVPPPFWHPQWGYLCARSHVICDSGRHFSESTYTCVADPVPEPEPEPCPYGQSRDANGLCASCPAGTVSLYGVCADQVPDESFCPFGTSFFNGGCVAQSNECDSGYQVVTDASTGAATCGTNQASSSPPTSSSQNSSSNDGDGDGDGDGQNSSPSASSSPPTSSSQNSSATGDVEGAGEAATRVITAIESQTSDLMGGISDVIKAINDKPVGGGGGDGPGEGEEEGAGQCDPTSKEYLSCLTGTSTGYTGKGEPAGKGTFDSAGAADSLQSKKDEFSALVESIKGEASSLFEFGSLSAGAGDLVDYCYDIRGVDVCFGWGKFADYLHIIAAAILLIGAVVSFYIVMGR